MRPARLVSMQGVQSRHPGRNPKLESSTLSYPAFEPLTERHALLRACSTELGSINTLGVRQALSVCWLHDKSIRASSFGRTKLYIFKRGEELGTLHFDPLGAASAVFTKNQRCRNRRVGPGGSVYACSECRPDSFIGTLRAYDFINQLQIAV